MTDITIFKKRLNPRQILFALRLASGMNQTEAWINAGYSKNGARQSSCRALTNVNISAYLDFLMQPKEDAVIMSLQEKRERLRQIVFGTEGDGFTGADRIRAIAEDNKMAGHYKSDKMELKVNPWADLLKKIRRSEDRIQPRQNGGSPQLQSAGN